MCTAVTNHAARKKLLMQKNRCFICLRGGHKAANCGTNMTCLKCRRKHHSTICECFSMKKSEENNGSLATRKDEISQQVLKPWLVMLLQTCM